MATPFAPETALLYRCTRQQLTADDHIAIGTLATARPLDWAYILAVAESHGVAPLVYANLQQVGLASLGIPPAIQTALQQILYRSIATKAGINVKLEAICDYCAQRGIDVMLLKGTALDRMLYADAWYVEHDVDLLLRCQRSDPNSSTTTKHRDEVDRYFWTLPGFEYEFDTHHDLTMNGLLSVDMARIWRDARPIAIGAQQAWVMGAEDLLITACINACRKRFFHLKSLLAIATLIDQQPTLCWASVAAKAHHLDVATLVYAALSVVQLTVGTSLPSAFARQLHLGPIRTVCLHRVVTHLLHYPLPCLSSAAVQPRPPDRFLLLPYVAYTPAQILGQSLHNLRRPSQIANFH